MSRACIVARAAVSALGSGERAFAVGGPGDALSSALSLGADGRLFGRASSCSAELDARPLALLELGLAQLVSELDLNLPGWRQRRVGAVIGTSSGALATLERWLELRARAATPAAGEPASSAARGPERQLLERAAYFSPLSALEPALGCAVEPLVSLYAACASSTLALGLGARWIELGYCELVIAGGYDARSQLVCAGFDSLKATSRTQPRPFRRERDGLVLGEGVALVALASRATLAPEARSRGTISGFATTTDAVHTTAPDRTGSGLARAAQRALGDARLSRQQLDFVSVHGTGTSFNDAAEAQALLRVFGGEAEVPPLHALKPIIGHTLGAAGALEALSALDALDAQVLPATASLGLPMAELDARLLPRNLGQRAERCLKLSTAFGGANAALVLARASGTGVAEPARAPRAVHLLASGRHVVACEPDPVRLASVLLAPVERLPRSDPLSALVVAAVGEALLALSARGFALARERTGVVVGSAAATLEADAAFAERVFSRGVEHAEPRRFPATSPNAGAGHAAIAFGLQGPSHAVGAGPSAALEALLVAHDWIAAGDAEAIVVVAAEQIGELGEQVFAALGWKAPRPGAFALVLAAEVAGPALDRARLLSRQKAGPDGLEGADALAAFSRELGR